MLMRALGHNERDIESYSHTIGVLFGMARYGGPLGPTLKRTIQRLDSALADSSTLTLCLLGRDCTFGIGKDAHIFSSKTVHMRPSDEVDEGSQVFETNQEYRIGLPDPVHVIVIHYRTAASADILTTFFHEGSNYDVSSTMYYWIKRNGRPIREGNKTGLYAYVGYGADGYHVDEGFAQTLFDSQASLVAAELEKLARAWGNAERRQARKLIAELQKTPPAAEFIRNNGLTKNNIFKWSRDVLEQMLTD